MRLSVYPGGAVVVTAPIFFGSASVEKFLASKSVWLDRAIAKMRHLKALPGGKREYGARRFAARALVLSRLRHFNSIYNFPYNRVSIKNTRSLWGSCSHKGNLNFSYKILYLPAELQDYIIIHELCHLKEHNHGAGFWALVAHTCPEYRHLRARLRTYILK